MPEGCLVRSTGWLPSSPSTCSAITEKISIPSLFPKCNSHTPTKRIANPLSHPEKFSKALLTLVAKLKIDLLPVSLRRSGRVGDESNRPSCQFLEITRPVADLGPDGSDPNQQVQESKWNHGDTKSRTGISEDPRAERSR